MRERIRSGGIAPDSRLPSLADMQHEYGVARVTVVKAMHALRDEGWVRLERGWGSYSTTPDRWPAEGE
ncbi:MAG: winged helix-turn-helix domain-containing protein [Streptosporangiaceae bacterium]